VAINNTKQDVATSAATSDRKMEIALKALELFAANGYDKTTVDEITDACHMSKGNFYYYFTTKEELVYLLRDWSVQDLNKEIEKYERILQAVGPVDTLKYYIRVYINNVDKAMDAYNFLNHVIISLGEEGRLQLRKGAVDVYALFEKILKAGIVSGEFQVENPALFAHNITRLGSSWAHNHWVFYRDFTVEQYIKQQTEFLLKAIRTN